MKTSYELLRDPFLNKGTAFTEQERERFGLVGLFPPNIQTVSEQVEQAIGHLRALDSDVARRHRLMRIFSHSRQVFYRLFQTYVAELMPVVYDPVIADAIENYSEDYVEPQEACFLSIDHPEQIEAALTNASGGRSIDLIVVTDAEAILGIGDWGTNGVEISVGKLMVYTGAAGIDPARVLPVVIDAGTNRQSLLDDPFYLGCRHKRIGGKVYYDFVDSFVQTAERLFPGLYLHFEDFGREHAAVLLDKYKNTYPVFNDDIEGTGIVTLAALLGALNITGEELKDQRYLCFGAGSAGCGIVERVWDEFVDMGMDPEEARSHFWLVDRQGLLFDDTEALTPKQQLFARPAAQRAAAEAAAGEAGLTTLLGCVRAVHPTIVVGTSTQGGAFTREVVAEIAAHAERPKIFPLSNPTQLAEATAADIITWTDGKALVATGVPREPVEYKGVTYHIGQANNALIYPGLGLGVLASGASLLTDRMISRAAHCLGGLVDVCAPGAAVLPPVDKILEFSQTVACGVAKEAIAEGIARATMGENKDAAALVAAARWEPAK